MNNIEVVTEASKRDIRWLKKHFFCSEFANDFSVKNLLGDSKLKETSLEAIYNKMTAIQQEVLYKKLRDTSDVVKRIIVFYEQGAETMAKNISDKIKSLQGYDVTETTSAEQDAIKFMAKLDSFEKVTPIILICLSKDSTQQGFENKISFAVGRFHKENVCVIYENNDFFRVNSKILSFVRDVGCSCDAYSEICGKE